MTRYLVPGATSSGWIDIAEAGSVLRIRMSEDAAHSLPKLASLPPAGKTSEFLSVTIDLGKAASAADQMKLGPFAGMMPEMKESLIQSLDGQMLTLSVKPDGKKVKGQLTVPEPLLQIVRSFAMMAPGQAKAKSAAKTE